MAETTTENLALDEAFVLVEHALTAGGAEAGFDTLIARFLEEKNYPMLFEARLMKLRHQLGLPLIQTELSREIPAEKQQAFDEGCIATAREVGDLFLAQGDIARAWPYYRAVGEKEKLAAAIDRLDPKDSSDAVVEIAYHEAVHPVKGFELILENYGTCRAITNFSQYPDPATRDQAALTLARHLHSELAAGIKRAIETQEGAAPETSCIPELIAGRDWLFEGHSYYTDTSHVASVIQMSIDWTSRESQRLALEMAEYGKHLSEMFQQRSEPPFDNFFNDYSVYLRALLGEDVDAAVAHFRKKVEDEDPDQYRTHAAQVLVTFLVRLKRFDEAVDASLEFLQDADPRYLRCPSVLQLCQMGELHDRMLEIARGRGDLLTYAAARIQQ